MPRKRPHTAAQKKARQAKFAKRRAGNKPKLGIPPQADEGRHRKLITPKPRYSVQGLSSSTPVNQGVSLRSSSGSGMLMLLSPIPKRTNSGHSIFSSSKRPLSPRLF